MILRADTERRHPIAALGVLLLFIVAIYYCLIAPIFSVWADAVDTIERHKIRLEALQSEVKSLPGLQHELDLAGRWLATSDVVWQYRSASEAGAAMQAFLRDAIVRVGGTVTSTSDLPAHIEHGLLHLNARVEAEEPLAVLAQSLDTIETSRPALVIEEIKVQVEGNGDGGHEPLLFVEIETGGYMRVPL